MNYANIKTYDIANGTGVRVSLFVSGCRHHCKGCFNAVAWDFSYGELFTQETINYILSELKPDFIEGLTLLGGEPFEVENQREIVKLLRQVKKIYPNKSIWAYSGYLFDQELLNESSARCEVTDEILSYLDVLVDGKFELENKNISLKFRGSSNQRIIDVKKSLQSNSIILHELNN